MGEHLTVRHFHLGSDVALSRSWPFHDAMAARIDIDYRLQLIGKYQGPAFDLSRPYVSGPQFWRRRIGLEAWVVRGWSHPLLVAAATCARLRRIPLVMWSERPGLTYVAENLPDAVRIRLRKSLLPLLFLPYRRHTVLLGTGSRAVADFCT